jgi:hypothetical protein
MSPLRQRVPGNASRNANRSKGYTAPHMVVMVYRYQHRCRLCRNLSTSYNTDDYASTRIVCVPTGNSSKLLKTCVSWGNEANWFNAAEPGRLAPSPSDDVKPAYVSLPGSLWMPAMTRRAWRSGGWRPMSAKARRRGKCGAGRVPGCGGIFAPAMKAGTVPAQGTWIGSRKEAWEVQCCAGRRSRARPPVNVATFAYRCAQRTIAR